MARGRPAIDPGEWGEVTVKQEAPKRWRAYVMAVTPLGEQRIHRPVRSTRGAAIDAATSMARNTATDGAANVGEINADMPLADYLPKYLDHRTDLSPRSLKTYRSAADAHIIPELGKLKLRAVTTPKVDQWLRTLPAGTAQTCRAVLSGAFTQAIRWGAATTNPVRETAKRKTEKADPVTLTAGQFAEWIRRVKAYQDDDRPGPSDRAEPLLRLIATIAGTGARPSEVLAMEWTHLDLNAEPPTAYLPGTKTRNAPRTVVLPNFAVKALQEQRASLKQDGADMGELSPYVWPTATGKPVSLSSLERWFRLVREHWAEVHGDEPDDLPHVTPVVFRRTVASLVAEEMGEYAASQQLGHGDTAVTRRHYIRRPAVGPDVAAVLDAGLMQE